jgi:hypothetical protein
MRSAISAANVPAVSPSRPETEDQTSLLGRVSATVSTTALT